MTKRLTWKTVSSGQRRDSDCDCTPPENDTFVIESVPADAPLDWSTSTGADRSVRIEPKNAPAWATITHSDGTLRVTGTSDGQSYCVLVSVDSDCGQASWIIQIPAPCALPCAASPTDIFADVSGEVAVEIQLSAPGVVVSTTGLDGASVSSYGTTLAITGEVQSGPYTVVLRSSCGECTVSGVIRREEVPPTPVCERIRFVRAEGNTDVQLNTAVNVCYVLSGTGPFDIDSFEGLPLGFDVVLDNSTNPPRVCVVGTALFDRCEEDPYGCRNGKITISNCAGTFDIPTRFFILPAPQPRPPFCVGMILIETTPSSIPSGYTMGWRVTANYFPPSSTISLGLKGIDSGTPVPLSTSSITVDALGYAVVDVFANLSGSGCDKVYLYATHPTCAVVSNFSIIAGFEQWGNDCDDNGGAGS